MDLHVCKSTQIANITCSMSTITCFEFTSKSLSLHRVKKANKPLHDHHRKVLLKLFAKVPSQISMYWLLIL